MLARQGLPGLGPQGPGTAAHYALIAGAQGGMRGPAKGLLPAFHVQQLQQPQVGFMQQPQQHHMVYTVAATDQTSSHDDDSITAFMAATLQQLGGQQQGSKTAAPKQ